MWESLSLVSFFFLSIADVTREKAIQHVTMIIIRHVITVKASKDEPFLAWNSLRQHNDK
jgi:hypothetical protein